MARSMEIYISWMKDQINKLEKYTNDLEYENFYENTEKFDACLIPLIQLGETAMQIAKFYPNYEKIPYKTIIWLRNILVHTYHRIDKKVIRDTIKQDIPELKKILYSID